jgi:hypothetical protein
MTTAAAEQPHSVQPRDVMADLSATMDDIVRIVQEETELVRAGRLADATALQATKTELANRYYAGARQLSAMVKTLPASEAPALADLTRKHEQFHALLQINLTVLATAHAVSEGIMRGVSEEIARKSSPSTYGAHGRPNAPRPGAAQPLAISRVL